jgi:hypothetical protein
MNRENFMVVQLKRAMLDSPLPMMDAQAAAERKTL